MSGAGRRAAGAMALLLTGAVMAGCADQTPPLGYYGAHYDEFPTAGGPRSPLQIYRRLLEDGYETFSPPKQAGAVYFVGVYNKRGQAACMILHAFSGAILQAYAYGKDGALNGVVRHTPGPGFPGAPPFPDGRYAIYCPPAPWLAEPGAANPLSAKY